MNELIASSTQSSANNAIKNKRPAKISNLLLLLSDTLSVPTHSIPEEVTASPLFIEKQKNQISEHAKMSDRKYTLGYIAYGAIAISSFCLEGGVSAFSLPSTTTRLSNTSPSLQLSVDDSKVVEGLDSRRELLGRAAGAFASASLGALCMPSSGFAAPNPPKVRGPTSEHEKRKQQDMRCRPVSF